MIGSYEFLFLIYYVFIEVNFLKNELDKSLEREI